MSIQAGDNIFSRQRGSSGDGELTGMDRVREESMSRDLVFTGEGKEGDEFFLVCWYRDG